MNVVPLEIGERLVGGPTLKIRDCLTTPLFRNPVAISIESTGIEKQYQQVAHSSEVDPYAKTYITQLAITTFWN